MAKRKTGKKVECFTIELCILSLARLSLKKKRDTCNVYKLNRQKREQSLITRGISFSYIISTCSHAGTLKVMRSNEILINFRWILTRTPTKLKRYLIQKDEIITQACQVECSNVDPKSIQIHWYMYIILRCSNMFSVFRMTVFWTVTYKIASTIALHEKSTSTILEFMGFLKLFLLQGLGLIESKLQHI